MQSDNRTKYIILTSPRSGSTWLVSLLSQLPGVTAYGELFLPRKRPPGTIRWDADFSYPHFVETERAKIRLRPLAVFAYLDELFQKPGVVGFKLMYSQLRHFPELFVYLLMNRVRIIHLIRHNPLDLLISQAVKRKLHQSHRVNNGQADDGKIQVELNPETLIRRLKIKQQKIQKARRFVMLTGLPLLEIFYEDLQKGPETFQSICSFISAPPQEQMPVSKFVKMRSDSQAEVLKNYNEVRKTLAGTQFTAYLE